ncbi:MULTISPECIES: hypothetical protein [Sphingobium]|uniref:Uncharacterized protein n=2 Tax=Sphingobium TaxID=165695 RepID=A0A9X7UEC7_SPHYA|nr:hypothetical protein [Sphingobium yanoikuyae]QNG48753.1 hypothetical protein H3V42_15300 [Sphingobium yanoikuyae]
MGIDDRDYMRERHRARAGATNWNDRAGRVEGAWFDPVNRGRDGLKGRFRAGMGVRQSRRQLLIYGLSVLLTVIPLYGMAQRDGLIPDLRPGVSFPETGSVTISKAIDRRSITSALTIVASHANAVVQLFDPATERHLMSIYVAANHRIKVPVPEGTYRMKLVEGQKWHGTRKFFGPNTSFRTVADLMTFTRSSGQLINLRRRPDGNMPTRPDWFGPEPL